MVPPPFLNCNKVAMYSVYEKNLSVPSRILRLNLGEFQMIRTGEAGVAAPSICNLHRKRRIAESRNCIRGAGGCGVANRDLLLFPVEAWDRESICNLCGLQVADAPKPALWPRRVQPHPFPLFTDSI